jgi:hypothetical protein
MNERIDRTNDFMNFVMTPPQQTEAKYDMYQPSVSTMRIVSNGGQGLGEVPVISSGGNDQQSWVMPVVIIVVSAMALMTLYAVLSKR